jgi:hypothetical protein
MVKFIMCECGHRYREDNKKHFQSKNHIEYLRRNKNNKNEIHIIVHDIDKDKLMKFIKNNCNDIISSESEYEPSSSSDSEEGENIELSD